jgi:sulfur relay protein TusB/DsrH
MLVMVKSSPDSTEGKRGFILARDMAADVVLLQNAVYAAQRGRLEGMPGAVYALDEDLKLRGIHPDSTGNGIKRIEYDDLVDLMLAQDNVLGAF